jgi:hypothetical protein
VLAAALQWLQGTLLGTVATAIAVIAVASVGFLLMSGRIDLRRAGQVVAGCFILFGASTIAAGIVTLARGSSVEASPAEPPSPPAAPATRAVKAVPYDPYAGAALPTRR